LSREKLNCRPVRALYITDESLSLNIGQRSGRFPCDSRANVKLLF
jgi:hypothetical protein